jgi:hypothetical protein
MSHNEARCCALHIRGTRSRTDSKPTASSTGLRTGAAIRLRTPSEAATLFVRVRGSSVMSGMATTSVEEVRWL